MSKIALLTTLLIYLFVGCNTTKRSTVLSPESAIRSLENMDTAFLGNFMDDYKIRYTVTNASVTQHPGVKYNLIFYNKKEQYFIAQNDTANVSDGGLYTRIDIIRFTHMEPWRWGFCLTAYKAGSIEEAIQTASADRANPKKGCGGYPFSRMRRL